MRQFIFTFANDETEESSTFQGTIPQALMMMNGEIMTEALSCKAGKLPAFGRAIGTAARTFACVSHGQFALHLCAQPTSLAERIGDGRTVPRRISR